MKRTINVCGYDIEVASNAASMIRYKMAFHRDAMKDLFALAKGLKAGMSDSETASAIVDNDDFDLEVFERFLWVFAKSANDNIPDMVDWLANFDVPAIDFLVSALPQVQDMLTANVATTVKSKKK